MLALSGDEILLGELSVPAGAAIDQFKLAESEITIRRSFALGCQLYDNMDRHFFRNV